MKVLVTGGAGFIGSHVADALIREGHEVHIIDDLSTGVESNLNAAATFFKADISTSEAATILKEEKYEVIFHHAAQLDVRKSVADPLFDARVNIMGSVNLLETGVHAGLKKFIFASSGGTVYGEQDYFPADENHSLNPVSPYGVAKLTVEKYLYYYHVAFGLPYVNLRYANIYGPRQNPHGEAGVIAIFANKILAGGQPVINGDGMQTRDYVMVEDVVKANLLALQYDKSGSFNVGTGVETTVVELFDNINESLGNRVTRQHGPAKAGEQRRSVLSFARTQKELGWTPQWKVKEGLKKTMQWFEQR
jgi:UDP-glucose 4-epimerase